MEEREKTAQPHPQHVDTAGFRLIVEDVFSVAKRGTVVVGKVTAGTLRTGDAVTLRHADGTECTARVNELELFRKSVSVISEGDNAGILLREISSGDVRQGDILYKGTCV